MFLWSVSVIILKILLVNCAKNTNVKSYEVLPPIFYIDDYEKCKLEQNTFCKVSIVLKRKEDKNNDYWNLIENSINDTRAYNHNELFHAVCTDNLCPELKLSNKAEWKTTLSRCYSRKYGHLGIEADVVSYNCKNHDNIYTPGRADYIWVFCLTAYGLLIIFSCYFDYSIRNKIRPKYILPEELGRKYLLPFSAISNWEKLESGQKNAEFQKLKCIQGIRFYNMLLIIFCHTYSSYIGGYVYNTSYIENISTSLFRLGIRNLMVFLVQTFFLFSAFLMSYHMFQVMDKHTKFNWKYIIITILNRYMRIIPPVLVMIGFGSTIWVVRLFYGPIKDLYSDLEYQRCQKNWWTTLLFINNHYNQHDMCYFITWYLAADTQLYILSLLIFSFIWMYKKNTLQILAACFAIGIIVPMVISYIYNLDIIYRITPENAKNNKFRSFQFNAIYSSSYANMATFMVGLYFGYFYYNNENKVVFNKMKHKIFWLLSFLGLPTLIICISSFYYSRFVSALLCGILKPIYAIGIAIGIFGMSQKVGGIIRSICEWPPAVFIGNFTYSTYVVHYVIVFYRTATAKQPLILSDLILITSFMSDACLSLLCGFIMHIFVEMPAQHIQKMILPQVRKQFKKFDENYKKL